MADVYLLDSVKVATSTTGTGSVTVGAAEPGYLTPAEAGAVDGLVYTWRLDDGDDFEIFLGTYSSSGPTVSRDTVLVSKISGTVGTSKLDLSGSAVLSAVPVAAQVKNLQRGVNVKDFGAKGDNSTDDTIAIQAAIDAVEATPWIGGVVYFPAGTYIVSSTLTVDGTKNIRIVGDGKHSSAIKFTGSGNCIEVSGNAGYFIIEHMKFAPAPADTTARAIDCYQAAGPSFRDCMFVGYSNAIRLRESYGFTVENCVFHDAVDQAIASLSGSGQNSCIDKCAFYKCGLTNNGAAIYHEDAESVTISNCEFGGGYIDIFLRDTTSARCVRNYHDFGNAPAIWMAGACGAVRVEDSWFWNDDGDSDFAIQNVDGFVFDGNTLSGKFSVSLGSNATNIRMGYNYGFGWTGSLSPANHHMRPSTIVRVVRTHPTIGLDTPSASQQAGFAFYSAGTVKWEFVKNSDESFSVWDNTGARAALQFFPDGLARIGPVDVRFPNISTTASGANAFLDSTAENSILRSTSSIRYKRDIEDLWSAQADAVLKLRPVWYRSKAPADRQDWSWYGLIAEEVAAIDPRLVHWGYHDDDYEEVPVEIETADGVRTMKERRLKEGAVMKPTGVQYDRLAVLLLDVVKRLVRRVDDLEQRTRPTEVKV